MTQGSIIITPLMLLKYNTNITNLASHGLHPRWLHILVNMPMMFGALYVCVCVCVCVCVWRCVCVCVCERERGSGRTVVSHIQELVKYIHDGRRGEICVCVHKHVTNNNNNNNINHNNNSNNNNNNNNNNYHNNVNDIYACTYLN